MSVLGGEQVSSPGGVTLPEGGGFRRYAGELERLLEGRLAGVEANRYPRAGVSA